MNSREAAGLPLYPELRWVTLEAIRRLPMPATNDEIDEAVGTNLKMTPVQRAVRAANGAKSELGFRVSFCRSQLKIVGALKSERRGYWRLTSEGVDMDEETVERRWAEYLRDRRQEKLGRATRRQVRSSAATGAHGSADDDEPGEAAWNDELLSRLLDMSPGAFERLAQELLRSSGFEAVKVIGGSGDGGIDGTALYRFSLISFPVYFQCKRHKGTVGAPVVRDFRGAMAGRGDRGLIITTGSFTPDAKREATRDGATPLDLIDGDNLCELLKERELGVVVRKRTVEDVTIDSEYFNRFEGASKAAQGTPQRSEGGVKTPSTERTRRSSPRAARWSYLGEGRSEKTAADMYEHIVGQLYNDCGGVSFYRKFRDEIATTKRSHIGESPREADPEERSIRSLPGGWYLNVHSPNQQKRKWIQAACECASIEFGKELIVEFRPE